jgi:hypothetical protein
MLHFGPNQALGLVLGPSRTKMLDGPNVYV